MNCFNDRGKPSILVFLPGFNEIFSFMEFVKEWYKHDDKIMGVLEFIPLHSSLNDGE